MNDYTKGILTGASLILCFFMFVSAKSQYTDGRFNRIEANEILADTLLIGTVLISDNAQGDMIKIDNKGIIGFSGEIDPAKGDLNRAFSLAFTQTGSGGLVIAQSNGNPTLFIGEGYVQTFNDNGEKTGYFGTNKENDGHIVLFDRYGDEGWGETGKK
jgi:hypothetical protein